MKKIKIKIFFTGLLMIGVFLALGTQRVFADSCSSANSGFVCIDKSTSSDSTKCQTGLCPGAANIQCCPPAQAASSGSTSFTNPLQFDSVEGLLGSILSAVQKIIVVLALIFIVIGAVLILSSAGTPDMVERGKKAITMALVGLALGLAAPSILKELAGVLGWGGAATLAGPSLSQIALNVLNFLLGIAGVLTLIMLVIGAIMYLTSAGDEERIESGKKIFKSALIGIVIVMASMIIVRQIALFFQGSSTSNSTASSNVDMTGL